MSTQAQINTFYYEEDLTESKADFLVKRKIKVEGVKCLLIIDSGESLKILEKKLKQRKVIKEGFYLILSSKGIYNNDIDGSLVVSESGTEDSISEANYHYLRVQKVLQQIPSKTNFRVYLKKLCESSELCSHSLINIQSSKARNVGLLADTVIITDTIVYPGNTTEKILNEKNTKIVVSVANGPSSLYHQDYNPFNQKFYQGAEYGTLKSNLNREIENFDLELFTTDCGSIFYEKNWFLSCFSEILPNMGIAYITGMLFDVLYGNLITLRALNNSIPQISPNGQDSKIGDKNLFPEIVSLSITETEYYAALFYFQSVIKWKSIILIGSDDPLNIPIVETVKNFLISYQISIVNPIETQVLPINYTSEDFQKYKDKFLAIKNTLCRVYLVLSFNYVSVIEGLYDAGLRKGDFIGFFPISASDLFSYTNVDQKKVKELLTGSLYHQLKDFVGDYGETIKKESLKITNNTKNFCSSFDSVLIIKESMNRLLAFGEDFEDPITLMNSIRMSKTIGCNGNLQIGKDSNFKMNAIISMSQISFEASGGAVYNEVITIDKYRQNPIKISPEIDWPVETAGFPSNFIKKNSCGLDERLIRDNLESKNIFLCISAIIFFVTLVSAALSVKYFNYQLPQIQKDAVQGLSDKFFLVFFFCEFFQISLQGNQKGVLYEYASNAFELAGFDFVRFFQYEFDQFWEIMKALIAIEFLFCFLCCIEVFLPKRCFEKYYFFSKVEDLNRVLLPILGHIGFIPLISMTLNIFICKEGISNNFEDSYLKLDCKTFCYQGKHKVFSILSVVSIVCFLVPAIILRPLWEKILFSNIKTKPTYLAILSVFEVSITLIHYILSFGQIEILGFINSSVCATFIIFTVVFKPYNYELAELIQKMILSLGFWEMLFGCFYFNFRSITIKVIQMVGMGLIIGFAAIKINKLEKVFKAEEDFPISNLILFQFSRNPSKFLKRESKNLDLVQMNKLNYLEEEKDN